MIPRRLIRKYTVSELEAAIAARRLLEQVEELEAKRSKLQKELIRVDRRIQKLSGDGSMAAGKPGPKRKRRRMSKSTRLKMAAAARARWAKIKDSKGN